jgi:uncharacterized damage-inducible protein DinB
MTREELITIAAVEHADKQLQKVDEFDFAVAAIADYDNGFIDGFKQGAQWADAHPQSSKEEFIEKACWWLRETAHFYVSDFIGELDDDGLIEDFKKAMEE